MPNYGDKTQVFGRILANHHDLLFYKAVLGQPWRNEAPHQSQGAGESCAEQTGQKNFLLRHLGISLSVMNVLEWLCHVIWSN